MSRWVLIICLAAGCSGSIFGKSAGGGGAGQGGGDGTGGGAGGPTCAVNRDDEVRLAMQGACIACHAAGNKPFFKSLEAFENGLAWNPKYVVPGNPDQSYLIALLEGRGTGTYPQMPQGQLYQAAVTAKLASIPLDEIKQWIKDMPAAPTDAAPSASAFSVRRLTAEEMVFGLMDQLGLELGDFAANPDLSGNSGRLSFRYDMLSVWPVDLAPGIEDYYGSDARAGERFLALGGPNTVNLRPRDKNIAPAAMQTLVQVSQAWCSLAVGKAGNKAIFHSALVTDTSKTNPTGIRQNIADLQLRMLGEAATTAQVDHLYNDLYLPIEAEQNPKTAWMAVCAIFVRHPLWMTY